MPVNPLLKQFSPTRDKIDDELNKALGEFASDDFESVYEEQISDHDVDSIITGRIVSIGPDAVLVDVGLKSEGLVPLNHFENSEELKEGDNVDVLLEANEDEEGLILLSKRKADRIRGWEKVISTYNEGDVVKGRVAKKIKGGLLVEIGVPVFLPASQIDIRRVGDVSEFIGREFECKIIKIDEPRMNIVVSRRKLLEEQREVAKESILEEIEVNQVRKGVVKNITDFGAFVDLGGIDGLLHITDMSWGRVNHPSEVVKINDEIDVMVLKVSKEQERISLGLKQTQPSPWDSIEEKYPIGSKVKGKVVNVLSYGAFVELEEGVEGLVHVSEMSWTRRVNHPSALVKAGDELEVVVLDIKRDKQEISLGMKQVEVNPWTLVAERYPPGTGIEGPVRNLTNYGAFIELEEGIDGLLHVSDMSWTRKVVHPSEMVKKGDVLQCVVLEVDQERKRIALGLKQLEQDPWVSTIPDLYQIGTVVRGVVTKTTNFGVFVQLDDELEGLLHVSELTEHKVESPDEIVKVGETVDVKVIKIDIENRKIGLSLRDVTPEDIEALNAAEAEARAEIEAAGGVVEDGEVTQLPGEEAPAAEAETPAAEASAEEAPAEEAPAEESSDEDKS